MLLTLVVPDRCWADYDVGKAVAYANYWCSRRNPSYPDYSSVGGDCSNFVSQCLIAGGFLSRSYPLVSDLCAVIEARGAQRISASSLRAGDVIVTSYPNHVVFVVGGSGYGARIAAHTTDRCNYPSYGYARCYRIPSPKKWAAQYHDKSGPRRMEAGTYDRVWIAFKNTGTKTWYHDEIRLLTAGPYDRISKFCSDDWITCKHPTDANTNGVRPGETVRFAFNIQAPMKPGTYREGFQLRKKDVDYFGPKVFFDIEVEAPWAAQYHNKSYPRTMEAGSTARVWVALKNIGSRTWNQDDVMLLTASPYDRRSPFATDTWISERRPTDANVNGVKPGETVRFAFDIRAPMKAGTYREGFQLRKKNVEYFGPKVFFDIRVTPYVAPWNARYMLKSCPQTMQVGTTATAWFEFKNTGDQTWYHDQVRLRTAEPADRVSAFCANGDWPSCSSPGNMNQAAVAPGKVGRCAFRIQAPSTPGTYTEAFQLRRSGGDWFGPVVRFTIVVNPDPPPLPTEGHIVGTVRAADNNLPLSEVEVALEDYVTEQVIGTTVTDDAGEYAFMDLPAATYRVSTEPDGFFPYLATVSVVAAHTVTQDFSLTRLPDAPVFTQHPAGVMANVGEAVTFSVAVDGRGQEVFYQWLKDGLDIGVETPNLTIESVDWDDEGNYRCVATSDGGMIESRVVSLVISDNKVWLFNSFEDGPDERWSYPTIATAPNGQRFLGEFGNQTVSLALDEIPPHGGLLVSFDLYVIRSWDGNAGPGPDEWEFGLAGGPPLVRTTFSNVATGTQAYPGTFPGASYIAQAGADGVDTLGYGQGAWGNAVYRMSFAIPHTASSAVLNFTGRGLQALADESWGLDNLEVRLVDTAISDFSLASAFSLVGNSALIDGRLRLTPSEPNQIGSAWSHTKPLVLGGFRTAFRFQIGSLLNQGAEGLCFVVQGSGADLMVGETGPGGNSLAVEFDTYADELDGDNHVTIWGPGAVPLFTVGLDELGINLKDGNDHVVNICHRGWDNPTLDVLVDNLWVVRGLSVPLDAVADPAGRAWFGFGARTGSTDGSAHDIIDLAFQEFPPPAPSLIHQPGLAELVQGEMATFQVSAGGPGDLSYQWYKDDIAIPGATGPTLTLPVAATDNQGNYRCRVSNSYGGSSLSIPAPLLLAPAKTIYLNNFESGVGTHWSQPTTWGITPSGRRFLGEFGNETVSLSLANMPAHAGLTISFDLFVIRSWDGNTTEVGPDEFELNVAGGPTLLRTTFTNVDGFNQAYPDACSAGTNLARSGAEEFDTLGYGEGMLGSSVYRLSFTFPHADNAVAFNFLARGLESLENESWGIDNIEVGLADVSFMNFASPDRLWMVGSAAIVDQMLRLTPTSPEQTGSAWSSGKPCLRNGFESNFRFRLTGQNSQPGGGNGFAFVVQDVAGNLLTDQTGPGGASLTIQFNAAAQEPGDTPDMLYNTVTIRAGDGDELINVPLDPLGIELKDQADHRVEVRYDGSTLDVMLDAIWIVSGVSIAPETFLDAYGHGWVGFSASTSVTAYQNQDILDWGLTELVPPPEILNHPAADDTCEGSVASFTVVAEPGWPLTYAWEKDGVGLQDGARISGATSATLTITPVVPADAGAYRCIVFAGPAYTVSAPATLTVYDKPLIVSGPAAQSVCRGEEAAFGIAVAGADVTYQWQKDGVDLHDGVNISGASGPTMRVASVEPVAMGGYRCVVTDGCGMTVQSSIADLAVRAPTSVTRQPVSRAVCSGHTARMMVAATGADLTYLWARDGVPLDDDGRLSGTISPILVIHQAGNDDQGTYTCRISGPCGTEFSQAAELVLGEAPCPQDPNGLMWEAIDINAGGDSSAGAELTLVTSTGQAGGVGDLGGGPYGTRDGFLAAASVAVLVVIVPADFDEDGDVDEEDFNHLSSCWTGPALGPPATGCENANLDGDGDIDQTDFGLLQRCFSGVGVPSDPACVP